MQAECLVLEVTAYTLLDKLTQFFEPLAVESRFLFAHMFEVLDLNEAASKEVRE